MTHAGAYPRGLHDTVRGIAARTGPRDAASRDSIQSCGAGHDDLTSGLLANALVHDLGCDAVAIRPSDLLQTLKAGSVALVVIRSDMNSIPGAGFDMANILSAAHPHTPILILMDVMSHESVIRAFRSGACGVFSLQRPMSDLMDSVEHVKKGYIWAGKEATASLLEALRSIPTPSPITENGAPGLTARELQVVRCAARGKTNKAIAIELRLSEHTVKNYLFRAFEKLGVSSRVELLFYLTSRGHAFGSTVADEEAIVAAD